MNDYTPTDEQFEAFADWLGNQSFAHNVRDYTDEYTTVVEAGVDLLAGAVFASPAFRSIIRAAQAEALRGWADHLAAVLVEDEDAGRFRDRIRARALNPTMRFIVEETRAEANRIESADV